MPLPPAPSLRRERDLARLAILDEALDDTDLDERGDLDVDHARHQREGVHVRDRLALLEHLEIADRAQEGDARRVGGWRGLGTDECHGGEYMPAW
jgi:hypothetical protein